MKRKLIALLCALLIGCSAVAESPASAPEIVEAAQSSGSMAVTLNGESLSLDFDPDPQYSICRDGYVQASFYAYGEGDLLYELYMTFPQNVQSGESITPESSLLQADIFSGLYLYASTTASETCSAATQFLTGAYPEGSHYTIAFKNVTSDGSSAHFEGSIDASLVQLDQNYNPTSIVDNFYGEFSFSMDIGGESTQPAPRQPESSAAPSSPEDKPESETPESKDPKAEAPNPLPDMFVNPYPPTPPSKLITPSNAQKI